MLECSITSLALGEGPQPVSLGAAGLGPIACLSDIIRAAGAGICPGRALWQLARDATVGREEDVGYRGSGGWSAASAEVEDDDREDEHGQRPDRGYGSGEGPLLGAGLARPEPVPGEVKKNRLEALDRRTARQVGEIYLNVYMWNAQRKYV